MFYLRLHPALIKERVDNEKQMKQNSELDYSVEWRQYCLDPLFTNYDRVIRNIIQSSSLTISKNSPPKIGQSSVTSKLPSIGSAPNASSSLILSLQQQQFNVPSDHFYASGSIGYSPMPISPSFIFANSNRSGTHIFSKEKSLKRLYHLANQNSKKLSNLVPSIPNTPAATTSQNTSILAAGSVTGTPQQLAFQYPPLSAYEDDKRPIQNLTSRFMNEEQATPQANLGRLFKSLSDSNLVIEPSHMELKLAREMQKKNKQLEPAWNNRSSNYTSDEFRSRVKSEMRDRNIIEDSLSSARMNFSSNQANNPAFFHSMSEHEHQAGYISDQISAQLARMNSSELAKSGDIISGFFSSKAHHLIIQN